MVHHGIQWTTGYLWGHFRTARAQRGHSANYYGVYPGNIPENGPPTEACMIKFPVYQQGLWGAEFRTQGPLASSKQTVVENSQLFAQRAHSARCAPYVLSEQRRPSWDESPRGHERSTSRIEQKCSVKVSVSAMKRAFPYKLPPGWERKLAEGRVQVEDEGQGLCLTRSGV